MHSKITVGLLCIGAAILRADELEFIGYLRSGSEVRFVVANQTKGTTSSWLTVGEKFREFTITSFDEKGETLRLAGPSGNLILQLKPSRVSPALPDSFRRPLFLDVSPPGTITIGQETADLDSLEKILAAAVAADPQVVVVVRARVEQDAEWLQSLYLRVFDLARLAGARGVGLISKPPNEGPKPTDESKKP